MAMWFGFDRVAHFQTLARLWLPQVRRTASAFLKDAQPVDFKQRLLSIETYVGWMRSDDDDDDEGSGSQPTPPLTMSKALRVFSQLERSSVMNSMIVKVRREFCCS
jgi:hypothetical protein